MERDCGSFSFVNLFITQNDVGDARDMEGQVVRDIPICSLYSRLYHLSSPKNHSLTLILGHLDLLSSPSLGFHCSFINRETTNVSASFSFSPLFTLCLGGEIPAFRSHVL